MDNLMKTTHDVGSPGKFKEEATQILCTCHWLPRGGGGQADVGEYGDFMGTLQQISALVVGEMWGLRFLNALLSGRMWGLCFCSTERRLGTIDCSLDRWQDCGGKEEGHCLRSSKLQFA